MDKIKQYVEIKKQIRDLENALKFLEWEIKDNLKEKVEVDGFMLSKKSRITYSLKPDIDMAVIRQQYPGICKVTYGIDPQKLDVEIIKQQYPEAYYEKVDVEAKKLYEVAADPKSLVDEKTVTYLEVKEMKEKKVDLDF